MKYRISANTYVGRFKSNDEGTVAATTREVIYTEEEIKHQDKHFMEFWLPQKYEYSFIRALRREVDEI